MNLSFAPLTADDMATLAMILRVSGLPNLRIINLSGNSSGDAGMQALCEGLINCTAPSLECIQLADSGLGPASAEAFAAALRRGALAGLERMYFTYNPIGNQGMAALAPLRSLPRLRVLSLIGCEIGDEGVTSLVKDVGKDDFKALETILLAENEITDKGKAMLVDALGSGRVTVG